jgi:hypothetical protein
LHAKDKRALALSKKAILLILSALFHLAKAAQEQTYDGGLQEITNFSAQAYNSR